MGIVVSVDVIRDPRERLSKCTLQPLDGRGGFRFHKAREGFRFDGTGYLLLALDGSVLSERDRGFSVLLLDSTWRRLQYLEGCLIGDPIRRSLPEGIPTAYPRRSKVFSDPVGGLA